MKKGLTIMILFMLSMIVFSFRVTSKNTDEYVTLSNEDKLETLLTNLNLDYSDYETWYKITKDAPNTGDPTGFLDGKHRGVTAYRDVYINKIGEAVNKGTAPYKYPVGTMIVKEEYKDEVAWRKQANPRIKLMVKLEQGKSPETGDWGYASKLNASKIATGTSSKAKFCTRCHIFVAAQGDYVFMNSDLLRSE